MFCRNCGCKNSDEAIFCRECGSKLVVDVNEQIKVDAAITPIIVPNEIQQLNNDAVGSFADVLKSIPKKIFMGIGAGIVAIAIIAVVVININSTINIDKYVEVSYEGYDGYGHATVSIDWARIQNKYGNNLKYTNAGVSKYGLYEPPVYALRDFINVPDLDKTEDLSNGDKLNYTWNIDEKELSKYIKCKVKYKDSSIEVRGLDKVETFDPFENLSVVFDGVGPAGYVKYEYTGDILNNYDFYVSQEKGLSKGDTVTISIDNKNLQYYANTYGKIPSITEKVYTVEGIGSYVSSVSEISEDRLSEIKAKVESVISEYTDRWSDDVSVDEVLYLGSYVVLANNSDVYDHNLLGIVYQINSHIQASENYPKVDVVQYYDVIFNNVAIKDDGTIDIDLNSYYTPRNSFVKEARYGEYSFSYNRYYYSGYESLFSLFHDRIKDYGKDYLFDWGVLGGPDIENISAGTDEYLCKYSSEREITRQEIETYINADYSAYNFPGGRTIVQMIINEMYAKKGYQFADDELNQYFNGKEWYTSIYDKSNDMDGIYKSMSSVELANIKLLQEYYPNKG